ncbi:MULTISPECIES: glycosyltransferase family 2 protein [Allochromatium]|jgi:cellulose synthase/poly-beta-1,6-N-acetylglucosamine synthase-like glycosyltransferase|uniref:Glycosyltransferase n=1 Tax=Allochromatium humboldtianum TaxID=504901 RepID=A0A850RF32_9GAMM|nr:MULTISPECIES: glycosyltransferase [Allochromatium]MBK1653747.1 glycosyl transferase family 2 [Allochromatium vinosum]NVZ09957.1 glycosyltransferase [Allochromatium humboldtianum]
MLAAETSVEYYLILGLVILALCSLNLVALTLARRFMPGRPLSVAKLTDAERPRVLVQLPLFNEGDLVERILEAVMGLDWPRDRLEIQVLDDSIDGSLAISQRAVAALKQQGVNIELLHRVQRTAFKAGALAAGLERSEAPFVAIFDADFIPPPDFLQRTVGALVASPDLAYVQTRWGHLNRDESLLTRIQARLLDSHFGVEQEARWRLGLPLPFNGTCGLWRRAAIDEAGGWDGDTLTEDLDLSLRANLAGWRSGFMGDLVVPGSLPTSARAWRVQQFRWTKGFVQCFIKLTPMVWRSRRLPVWQKIMISFQIGQPLAFVVGVACLIMGLPFMAGAVVGGAGLSVVASVTSVLGFAAPIMFLTMAGRDEGVRRTAIEILGALALTSGLLLSNARGGLEALLGHRTEFVRTPKARDRKTARTPLWRSGVLELGAGLALLTFALIEQPVAVLYLAMLIGGLVGIGAMQVIDGLALARPASIRN